MYKTIVRTREDILYHNLTADFPAALAVSAYFT